MPSVIFRNRILFLAGLSEVESIGVRGEHVLGQLV